MVKLYDYDEHREQPLHPSSIIALTSLIRIKANPNYLNRLNLSKFKPNKNAH